MRSTCCCQADGRLLVAMVLRSTISGRTTSRGPFGSSDNGGSLGFGTVLFQTWHDLHQIAGAMPVVELVAQDALPGILASARRARQTEDIGPAREAGTGARLDGRSG